MDSPTAVECPTCGAALPGPAADGSRTCKYCETVVTPPAPPEPPKAMAPPPQFSSVSTSSAYKGFDAAAQQQAIRAAKTGATGCGVVGVLITLLIVGGIAAAIFGTLKGAGVIGPPKLDFDGASVFIPADAGGGPADVLSYVRHYDSARSASVVQVARFGPGEAQPRWTSVELDGSGTSSPLVVGGSLVYVGDERTVKAIKLTDGNLAWKGALTDKFTPGSCEGCLFVSGSLVVVRTTDYVYRAFDAATGAERWTRRANSASARAFPFGETVLFVDDDSEHDGTLTLVGADGSEVTSLKPYCVGEFGDDDLETSGTIIPLATENAVVLGYGFGTACWQRVDLGSGAEVWKTLPDNTSTGLTSESGTTTLQNGDEVVLGKNDELATLNVQTGEYHELPETPDSQRVPIGVREGTVIVRAQNQRGTRTYSFQALDAVTGQLRWSVDMGEAEAGDGPGAATIFLSTGDRRFISHVEGDTLHILTFDHDSRELRIDNVTISTGSDTKLAVASGVDDSLPDLVPGAWQGATVSFGIEDTLFVLDTSTAKIEYRYP